MTSLQGLLLPAISLGTGTAAFLARLVRSAMLEVLNSDYIRTARAKGMKENRVVLRHALRNALIPIITVAGFQIGGLLGGAVITESIFGLAGMGTLIIKGITNRDYPVIQGTVMFIAFTYLFVNLIVDVMYAYVDPSNPIRLTKTLAIGVPEEKTPFQLALARFSHNKIAILGLVLMVVIVLTARVCQTDLKL